MRYRVVSQRDLFAPVGQLTDPQDAVFVTAEQAIGDLASLKAGDSCDMMPVAALPAPTSEYQRRMREGLRDSIANISVPRINKDTKIRLSELPPGGNFRDLPKSAFQNYTTCLRKFQQMSAHPRVRNA